MRAGELVDMERERNAEKCSEEAIMAERTAVAHRARARERTEPGNSTLLPATTLFCLCPTPFFLFFLSLFWLCGQCIMAAPRMRALWSCAWIFHALAILLVGGAIAVQDEGSLGA